MVKRRKIKKKKKRKYEQEKIEEEKDESAPLVTVHIYTYAQKKFVLCIIPSVLSWGLAPLI